MVFSSIRPNSAAVMEDYDTFVQHRLSQARKSTEEDLRPPSASSLIRYHGRPILPPLLSRGQREEMKQLREKMQKTAAHTKFKGDQRMTYVQTVLQSVQPRKMSTLEELLQESEIETAPSHQNSSRSLSHCHAVGGFKESLSITPVEKFKNCASPPPLTSTTYSALSPSKLTLQQRYHEGSLNDLLDSQLESQPNSFSTNHPLLSSGYVTQENAENTTAVSGGIYSETKSCGFVSSDEVYKTVGVFLQKPPETAHIKPDIISHPPIDGEELERSGLESPFSSNLIGGKDIFFASFHNNSVTHDHHLSEEHKDNISFSPILDPVNNVDIDRNEDPDSLRPAHCLTTELHVPQNLNEAEPDNNQEDKEDTEPTEEKTQSHPLSLQALLKKSQEYRRRQRMLRNQAKNTKIQERTQGQPRARSEEQSHSDKENDEFPDKGTLTAEGKKTKERRGTFKPSVKTSLQKSWENEEMIEMEVTGKKTNVKIESIHVTEGGNNNELTSAEEKATLKNNKLNSSQEVVSKPKQINAFIQQQPSSPETSHVQEAFYGTTHFTSFCKGLGKYHSVPTPNFSQSPVPCKSKGSIRAEQCFEGLEASEGETINSNTNMDKVQGVNVEHQNSHTTLPFTLNLQVEEDVTNVLAQSSQHIDQLESNLSSLKALITDLESTVKENMDYHCQTDNSIQSETSYKSMKHSEQRQSNHNIQLGQKARFEVWEEKLGVDEDDDMKCREWLETHPFLIHENSDLQSCTNNADDVLSTGKKSIKELKQSKVVKTLGIKVNNTKEVIKEESIKSSAQCGNYRRQQPPGKTLLSIAQQRRVPSIFNNVPSENMAPSVISMLSETSNHIVEKKDEVDVDGHDSIPSPSLNQSYDVDTPSDLWLQAGWGSDLHSQSCLGQDKHLTPDSVGEDQEGRSKVKRRLLMHVTEESQEDDANSSGGIMSVARSNSSTPRAAVHWFEGLESQRNQQEHLKQAHAAQVRALQDEHRKQQEELLQVLAVRYRLLQNMSFPCSMSSTRLGGTLTFSSPSQPLSPLSQRYRPLVSAAVKGFLTRRLLRTERVAQLVRTIRDMQEFLQAFQQQSAGREEFCSRQDILLQDRVFLQLRAARYEFYDIFFSLSSREQMQLISWDRELTKERALRQQNEHADQPRGKTLLSAATQKSLERKKGIMIQKRAAESLRAVMMRTGQKSAFSFGKQEQIKRGQFRANPERVPKSTCSSRPR